MANGFFARLRTRAPKPSPRGRGSSYIGVRYIESDSGVVHRVAAAALVLLQLRRVGSLPEEMATGYRRPGFPSTDSPAGAREKLPSETPATAEKHMNKTSADPQSIQLSALLLIWAFFLGANCLSYFGACGPPHGARPPGTLIPAACRARR